MTVSVDVGKMLFFLSGIRVTLVALVTLNKLVQILSGHLVVFTVALIPGCLVYFLLCSNEKFRVVVVLDSYFQKMSVLYHIYMPSYKFICSNEGISRWEGEVQMPP